MKYENWEQADALCKRIHHLTEDMEDLKGATFLNVITRTSTAHRQDITIDDESPDSLAAQQYISKLISSRTKEVEHCHKELAKL